MNYKDLNDYELIYQVRENNDVAYNVLLGKYSNLVHSLVMKYLPGCKKYGIEYEDLHQEGMLGIVKAMNYYNTNNETVFYTYALLCAKREIEKIIKTYGRLKHKTLNDAFSLSTPVKDTELTYEDIIPDKTSIEEEFLTKELCEKIMEFKYDLSLLDSSILELKLNGFTSDEIYELLDVSKKIVDYRSRKIKERIIKKLCYNR